MASNLSWSMVVDSNNAITDSKMTVEILAIKEKVTFDLVKIFTDFMEYTQCQMRVIANGVKQKLADDLARASDVKLTPVEMKKELTAMWDRLVGGTWFKPGGGVSSMKKKVDEGLAKATLIELDVMLKLNLITKEQHVIRLAEIETEEAKIEAKATKK